MPYNRSSFSSAQMNGNHGHRADIATGTNGSFSDFSGPTNLPNDDTQSHTGSASQYSPEDIATRLRQLELHVYGPQSPHARTQPNKSTSTTNEAGQVASSDLINLADQRQRNDPEGSPEGGQQGWRLEVKRWKRVPNKYGSADLYDESEKIEDIRRKEAEIRHGGYVLSAYDDYDLDGKKLNTFLRIHSAELLTLLRKIITFYPGDDFDILSGKDSTDDTVTFPSPFMIFCAYWKKLHQALNEAHEKGVKAHLKMLLDFIKLEHPITTSKLMEIEEGKCKKISFDKLWLLYPPNTAVYSFKGADERQVVVYAIQNDEMSTKGPIGHNRELVVKCWEVTWQSKHGMFTREFRDWIMHPYSGEKNVQNLELVPSRYVSNEAEKREKLIARGRHYFGLNQGHFLQDYFGDKFPHVFKDEGVRVVVDDATYFAKHPDQDDGDEDDAEDYGFPENEESLVDNNGLPLDTTLLRCFPKIGVFSLRNKEWALVKVDDLKNVTFRPKAFRKLVIDPENKTLIKAMVEASGLDKPGFRDLVSGKGRGLTILLHGPSGTGKTLTAECVAEKYQRPLFAISCGDLGTSARDLESNLKEVFQQAVTWKAILLLDEADIFLTERDVHNVERNALVSVFLRELDYFEGILFLSTNRPGEIDEAFVSRIHITLGLKALTKDEQHKIWAIFIKDLDLEDDEKIELLDHVKSHFRKDRLNGRQIRNAVRTALALAQLQNEQVGPKHLNRVMKPMRDYTAFLQDLNGGDSEMGGKMGEMDDDGESE